MLSTPSNIKAIFEFAPEWERVASNLSNASQVKPIDLFNHLGAKVLYAKAIALGTNSELYLQFIRDEFFQPHLFRMLQSNQNLKRFLAQRHLSNEEQRQHIMSFSFDLSQKMERALSKNLDQGAEDGFKVLLPAYLQRSVQNAVVDYIRQESNWERQSLLDNYNSDSEDPRQNIADDLQKAPENLALSQEKVRNLNQLRAELKLMLTEMEQFHEAFCVVDCLFGLGLTKHSQAGCEMTMRECCESLAIAGDTQARRIARCQVLLDKALDLIRQRIRASLPTLVEAWQGEININTASRRELTQQLDLTEGEVERLLQNRQFNNLEELVAKGVAKAQRLSDIVAKGGTAAFVPVDINSATVRDLIDILGLSKELAQTLASERPFTALSEIEAKGLCQYNILESIIARGAVIKAKNQNRKRLDLNCATISDLIDTGIKEEVGKLLLRGRPFLTWSECEDYLSLDTQTWILLRQKFCLGLSSA